MASATTAPQTPPEIGPPRSTVGVIGWARANLFSSVGNTVLTLLGLWLAIWIGQSVIDWAFVTAIWNGPDGRYVSGFRVWQLFAEPWAIRSGAPCRAAGTGACWPFIANKFPQFIYGRYPVEERWRVDVTLVLLVVGLILLMVPRIPAKVWSAGFLFLVFPVLAFWLLSGGGLLGLPVVKTEVWGGFLVTLVVALVGLTGAFPVGVLLALGRRSTVPWQSMHSMVVAARGSP